MYFGKINLFKLMIKLRLNESVYDVRLTTDGFKVVELLQTEEQSSEDW